MKRLTFIIRMFTLCALVIAGCSGSDGNPVGPDEEDPDNEPEPSTGSIEVVIATTGSGTDSDGYTLTLDGATEATALANETVTIDEVEEGSYTVAIEGVASNCAVSGNSTQSVSVTAGSSVTVNFNIDCVKSLANKIVYIDDSSSPEKVYAMDPDGSNKEMLFEKSGFSSFDISPDGTRITFSAGPVTNSNLYVINADGTGEVELTSNSSGNNDPAWSPDGTQIVFSRSDSNNDEQIFVINDDGTNLSPLTDNSYSGREPHWSPDGSKIVFDAFTDNYEIAVMDANGSNLTFLTNNSPVRDQDPVWSPDGRKIAFASTRDGNFHVYTMNTDGSNVEAITSGSHTYRNPSWSPDGSSLVFDGYEGNSIDVFVFDTESEALFNRTEASGNDEELPKWGPAQ